MYRKYFINLKIIFPSSAFQIKSFFYNIICKRKKTLCECIFVPPFKLKCIQNQQWNKKEKKNSKTSLVCLF